MIDKDYIRDAISPIDGASIREVLVCKACQLLSYFVFPIAFPTEIAADRRPEFMLMEAHQALSEPIRDLVMRSYVQYSMEVQEHVQDCVVGTSVFFCLYLGLRTWLWRCLEFTFKAVLWLRSQLGEVRLEVFGQALPKGSSSLQLSY